MSGGHFDYSNDNAASEIFGWGCSVDYGMGDEEYEKNVAVARKVDPMEDRQPWCVGDNPCDERVPSNADHIRSMTNEELAEWLWERTTSCPTGEEPQECCFYAMADGDYTSCKQCWLSWLATGVKE